MSQRYPCPCCGYLVIDKAGSYEICPSCGFQFGVSDDDRGFSYDEWRSHWVGLGMPWNSAGFEGPPAGWDPTAQLSTVTEFPPSGAQIG